MPISINDLDPEQLKALGIKAPRQHSFTKESVRSQAIRVLNVISGLTQDQRRRVLEHAVKVNRM